MGRALSAATLRLDKALWYLRLAKTRVLAQQRIAEGHVRLNGRRVERSAQAVAAGDVLTLPREAGVAVIALLTLPARRGPAPEAQACYRVLDASAEVAIAPGETAEATGKPSP